MQIKIQLKDKTQYPSLVKFLDIDKFIDFLISNSFHFTRLDKFEDKTEAISQRQLSKFFNHNVNLPPTEKKELNLFERQKRYFASCWFSGKRESIGMWNLYSNSSGVALKINLKDFLSIWQSPGEINTFPNIDFIETVYINKISYKNFLDPDGVVGFKDEVNVIGFHKDECFSHEKEVRILLKCNRQITLNNKPTSISNYDHFKIFSTENLLNKLNFQVIFHPQMSEWKKNNIRELIKLKNIKISTKDSELKPFFSAVKS